MTLMKADADGSDLWDVRLVQSTGRLAAFDVELRLKSLPIDAEDGSSPSGMDLVAATSASPVPAGRWTQIEASWDGREGVIAINGVPRKRADRPMSGARSGDATAKGRPLH